MKISKRKNTSVDKKNEQEKNNKNNSILKYVKGRYVFGTLLAVVVVVLTLTFSNSSLVNKSYALGNGWQWEGYDLIDKAYTENKGWSTGYFFINLYKGETRFISATFKVSKAVKFDQEGTNDNWRSICNSVKYFSIDYNGTGVGDYRNWVQVGTSGSKRYPTNSQGLTQSNDPGCYYYAAPNFKVKIPKGYYYYSGIKGNYTTLYPNGTVLVPVYCKSTPYIDGNHDDWDFDKCSWASDAGMLFADSPKAEEDLTSSYEPTYTPRAEDRWTTGGRLSINIAQSTGVTTLVTHKTTPEKYYRHRQSYSIKFRPNKTTISFNANGGSGAPSSQTKTYDSTLTLTSSKPTRSGYTFDSWNTKADGSGTQYSSGQSLDATLWPATSSVTLYAQWRNNTIGADSWCGSTVVGSSSSTNLGWKEGQGYIHLGKCKADETDANNCTPYSSTGIKSTLAYSGATSGTNAYYTYIRDHTVSSTFSILSGGTTNFQFVNTSVSTAKTSLNGGSLSYYFYMNGPDVKVKAPKGYKYWTQLTPYPSPQWTGNTEFTIRKSDGSLLFESSPGPYPYDIWLQGKLALNIVSIGHRNTNKYRAYKSYCIAFKPNTRTIKYNANGGSGTMSNDTYVYSEDPEEGLEIRTNTFERTGYSFIGWNTSSNGTGEWYNEGDIIPGNKWPSAYSDLNLYAIWGINRGAKIYYNASNGDGTTDIQSENLSCTVGEPAIYRLYEFYNTSNNHDYLYLLDSAGSPISGIPITVWSNDTGDILGDGTTDSDGKIIVDEIGDFNNDNLSIVIDSPYGDSSLFYVTYPDGFTRGATFDPSTANYVNAQVRDFSKCSVTIPGEILDSVGQYNNRYAGLASSTGSMSSSISSNTNAITITSNAIPTYYAVYSEPVDNYYYSP